MDVEWAKVINTLARYKAKAPPVRAGLCICPGGVAPRVGFEPTAK